MKSIIALSVLVTLSSLSTLSKIEAKKIVCHYLGNHGQGDLILKFHRGNIKVGGGRNFLIHDAKIILRESSIINSKKEVIDGVDLVGLFSPHTHSIKLLPAGASSYTGLPLGQNLIPLSFHPCLEHELGKLLLGHPIALPSIALHGLEPELDHQILPNIVPGLLGVHSPLHVIKPLRPIDDEAEIHKIIKVKGHDDGIHQSQSVKEISSKLQNIDGLQSFDENAKTVKVDAIHGDNLLPTVVHSIAPTKIHLVNPIPGRNIIGNIQKIAPLGLDELDERDII